MLAALTREMLEEIEAEDAVDDNGNKTKKQKRMAWKKGKKELMKFFKLKNEKAEKACKDDIEVTEPATDAEGVAVDLSKKTVYCTLEDGEVTVVKDSAADPPETIKIEKKDDGSDTFTVTRNDYEQECGDNNTADTCCEWVTQDGNKTRYICFGSALLSGDDVEGKEGDNNSGSHSVGLATSLIALVAIFNSLR